ncbi:hypothetical protein H5410_011450 [Solanum commersonii]|uniref:Uncharacterized protein n=1 Tax=Solanum commersonii TaxID=4109 RepID=A0A9J6ANL0_SOLCO|nr:hypothetical protein H5410_011450 [Solanum commersonii]
MAAKSIQEAYFLQRLLPVSSLPSCINVSTKNGLKSESGSIQQEEEDAEPENIRISFPKPQFNLLIKASLLSNDPRLKDGLGRALKEEILLAKAENGGQAVAQRCNHALS